MTNRDDKTHVARKLCYDEWSNWTEVTAQRAKELQLRNDYDVRKIIGRKIEKDLTK